MTVTEPERVTTLLVADDLFLEHITPTGHPERPDRLRAIARALSNERFAGLTRIGPKPADDAVLATAHDPRYVAAVRAAMPAEGIAQLDADTWVSPRSFEVAANAVGGAMLAVD